MQLIIVQLDVSGISGACFSKALMFSLHIFDTSWTFSNNKNLMHLHIQNLGGDDTHQILHTCFISNNQNKTMVWTNKKGNRIVTSLLSTGTIFSCHSRLI